MICHSDRIGMAMHGAVATSLPAVYNLSSRDMNQHSTDQNPRKLIIAIDGPAGAGKSTIASRAGAKTWLCEPGERRDVSGAGAESH